MTATFQQQLGASVPSGRSLRATFNCVNRHMGLLALGAMATSLVAGCMAGERPSAVDLITAPANMPASAATPPPSGLTIGINYHQPGLAVMGPDSTPHGFDVDVALYVAQKLGVPADRIAWREINSDNRADMIKSGAVDFVVAPYSMDQPQTPVSFAGPYLVTGQDLLVRADNTDITKPESLNHKTVCTAAGSGDTIKKALAPQAKILELPTYSACVDAVLARQADAATTDGIVLAGYAAQHPGLARVVGHPFTQERWGIGLKRGDDADQAKITAAIHDMIADGTWARAMQTEFGPSYRSLPPPSVVTAPDH